MKKLLTVLFAISILLACSMPAFAYESKLSGSYLVNAFVADLALYDGSNKKPDRLVEQRFKFKYTGIVSEYIDFTYVGEINQEWGEGGSSGGRRSGGAAGASAVSLENKNLYACLAIPGTSWKSTVGYQTMGDNTDGFVFGDYYDGIRFRGQAFNGTLDVGWARAFEGDTGRPYDTTKINEQDDVDMVTAQYQGKKIGNLKPSLDLIYISNRRPQNTTSPSNTDLGVISIPADAKENLFFIDPRIDYSFTPDTKLTSYLIYEFGDQSNLLSNGKDVNVSGYLLMGKIETKDSNWSLGAHVVYASADDNAYDGKQESIRTPYHQVYDHNQSFIGQPSNSIWLDTGLMIMAGSAMGGVYPGGPQSLGLAVYDGYLAGYGLTAAVINGSYVPAALPKAYVKASVGSFSTNIDNRNLFAGAKEHDGKYLGSEAALHIGYNPYSNLDLSLNFAYAWLGSFYNNTSTGKSVYNTTDESATSGVNITCSAPLYGDTKGDPDNPCMVAARARVTF
ncbi:MAG: hypothetical protein LLG43_03990 [Deltaproteobacteria bacterium]|nr:hypothetical protein [Deltaproteobacteria bacterium]